MKKLIILLAVMFCVNAATAEELNWPFLDNTAIKANEFLKAYPEYDGRGTVIFILDCGVDPSIAGLTETSEDKTKVIDIQDFTGQLVLTLKEAELQHMASKTFLKCGDNKYEGVDGLTAKATDGKYYIGHLDEEKSYKNSVVHDINSNGKTNDIFPVLVYKAKAEELYSGGSKGMVKPEGEIWVYVVDQDTDGHFEDEEIMSEYKYNFDTFNFYADEKNKRPLLTFSATVKSEKEIVINTCDGAHGSHCAGMAAGYKVYGANNNNGIAPGAYVVSLKIGDNVLSGGATTTESMKKAYEYGIEFMKEAGFKNAVFSMSYGIGSETPGRSDIDLYLNEFALKHPEAVIVKSMGNSGPGINSTGNPAGIPTVLSVGAMIPPRTLKDLYGSPRKTNWVTHFSSRGGETPKPDVMATAAASSTVPAFTRGDAFWGTSMSTPEIAGACALLLSAANANGWEIDGQMIRKAIKYSAQPMDGYSPIDYGNGLADMPRALKLLETLAKRNSDATPAYFKISTANTFFDDNRGPAAFWKSNGYFPEDGSKQSVSVTAVFDENAPKKAQEEYYGIFKLEPTVSWIDTDKSKIYVRGTIPASFNISYDRSKMSKPGLYVGRIKAYSADYDNAGYPDFDVQASVVIPYQFNQDNDYYLKLNNRSLAVGDIERIFVNVPPSAAGMNIKMSPAGSNWYEMGMYLFAPDGRRLKYAASTDNSAKNDLIMNIGKTELDKGIWEIIPYCYYQSAKTSEYNLEVKFYGVAAEPEIIDKINFTDGSFGKSEIKLFNDYTDAVKAKLQGAVEGYSFAKDYVSTDKLTFKKKIIAREDISKVEITVDMCDAEFNKVTDLAVNIYNSEGKTIYPGGMSRKSSTMTFRPPSAGTYELELVPAFVSEEIKAKDWKFNLEEKYYYNKSVGLNFNQSRTTLIPGTWLSCAYELSGTIPVSPDGACTFGIVTVTDTDNEFIVTEIPIKLEK